MKKIRHGLSVMMLGFALATGAEPVRAGISDCYGAVIDDCSDAMDGEGWFSRWAIGAFCTGLLAGCIYG